MIYVLQEVARQGSREWLSKGFARFEREGDGNWQLSIQYEEWVALGKPERVVVSVAEADE